jgi:hypothetical protein
MKCRVKRAIFAGKHYYVDEIVNLPDDVAKAFGKDYLEVLENGDTKLERTKDAPKHDGNKRRSNSKSNNKRSK